jgi:hypothetical protein
MLNRTGLNVLLLAGLALVVVGCSNTEVGYIQVSPAAQSLAAGQTVQFTAAGITGHGTHPTSSQDVTNQVIWTSSTPAVATVSSSGLSTAVSIGTATISASMAGSTGATATITVTSGGGGTSAPGSLLSLTIIPSTITVGNLQDTGNFLAIGTYSTSPTVRDVTNSVTWLSSVPNVFPVNTNTGGTTGATAGIVTAYGDGDAVIIAEATDPTTGSIQTATAEFSCPLVLPNPTTPGSCYPGSQASALLSTVTVYNEGLNTTNWLVEADSATGTKNVIHCGPGWAIGGGTGGSVCVATYPVGTTVTLTAPAGTGAFGGWSSNCTPNPNPPTAAGPNQCMMITTSTNQTVGAIFN